MSAALSEVWFFACHMCWGAMTTMTAMTTTIVLYYGPFTLNVSGASASTPASYLIKSGYNTFLERLAWFIRKSKQFNVSDITSDITVMTLTPSVNGPLMESQSQSYRMGE